MSTEIENATKNFHGGLPAKIRKFYEFLTEQKPPGFLDYETIEVGREHLSALLNENVIDEFIPFYVDNGHACYSIWVTDTTLNPEELPVMYNDTEGTYTLVASNFDEFIYLLSFNLLPALASAWTIYRQFSEMGIPVVNPVEQYHGERLAEEEQSNKAMHPDYELFKSYIIHEMGITYDTNPAELMGDLIKKSPDIVAYISGKDGFRQG